VNFRVSRKRQLTLRVQFQCACLSLRAHAKKPPTIGSMAFDIAVCSGGRCPLCRLGLVVRLH
jgi:hypothetical protein